MAVGRCTTHFSLFKWGLMFTGGTIWILTHGHIKKLNDCQHPRVASAWGMASREIELATLNEFTGIEGTQASHFYFACILLGC